ncbi:MAG: spore coat protein CotJB [Clostridia bacterium]|nr:spore coat protein CotJB [Clostridia bacterium]
MNDKERLLAAFRIAFFKRTEANLFLDTHPEDREALRYFRDADRELLEAKEAYERRFGPLSPDGESVRDGKFIWIAAPWPWQGEA